jgi:hypothetical protein
MSDTTQSSNDAPFEATGFFRVEQREGRWRMVDPEGRPFVSIGLNHADETNLKFPRNLDVWRQKYGSRESWIRDGVVKDLREWGFNTLGWTQEYISGGWGEALDWFGDPIDLGHSTAPWSATEIKSADMPYILQVRVAEIEDWNGHPSFRDVYSEDFDVYCEYLARSVCFDHAESENLIGYFLVDIPAWLPHASGDDFPQLKGLEGDQRDEKLFDVATKYYETITKHIRRVDPNHLVLGDRYNGNKGIPVPVLEAMKPFVDVLSVQYFTAPTQESRQQMRDDFQRWHEITGKPVLNADLGNWAPTKLNPHRVSGIEDQAGRGEDYVASIQPLLEEPWFLGWHWCGYVENTGGRGWGLKDPWDEPYSDMTERIAEFNKAVTQRSADLLGDAALPSTGGSSAAQGRP